MSDTGGNVSNYAGPVCEGHVFLSGFGRANNILGGVPVDSQHYKKVTQMT